MFLGTSVHGLLEKGDGRARKIERDDQPGPAPPISPQMVICVGTVCSVWMTACGRKLSPPGGILSFPGKATLLFGVASPFREQPLGVGDGLCHHVRRKFESIWKAPESEAALCAEGLAVAQSVHSPSSLGRVRVAEAAAQRLFGQAQLPNSDADEVRKRRRTGHERLHSGSFWKAGASGYSC